MESRTLFLSSIAFPPSYPSSFLPAVSFRSICFGNRVFLNRCSVSGAVSVASPSGESSARFQSLRVLEWDKLCDSVASFAGTSLGREAAKTRLWSLDQTYEESMRLLSETNAAVEMHRRGGFSLDFSSIDSALVKSAIQHARRDLPMSGHEAIAVASLLQFADTLQLNLRAAIKEDAEWHGRFMPLSDVILELTINRVLIRSIQQVLDEDGSVKDSASPLLKRSREQVQMLEKRLNELMDKLMRNDRNESSFLGVSNVNGRWCIKSGMDKLTNLNGLLISSGSGNGNIIEPLAAVPLNDELQRARALVAKAEEDVLLMLTKKMQMDLDETEILLNSIIQLDTINARATYSLSYGGTCPDLLLLEEKSRMLDTETSLSENKISKSSNSGEWTLFLPKAYHPLLVQQHRLNLRKARKNLSSAAAEIGRRKMRAGMSNKGESEIDLGALKEQVAALEQAKPVAVDFSISRETKVLVITGPNTGGKTVCLKTIGLAALMAKSGLYILSAESVQIPWFDSVFADIGDEQSLSQSLSTFSGHLKQISDIRSKSTKQSLVLLDEVGAGTNPLEGAALGMSLLESFANVALLTIATTHHGELKTLKYSAAGFENACMEFDEVHLKPTYKILWGIPGRSNAISIAERLGLPDTIVNDARELYGTASAEINELITDMEKYKQEFRELQRDSQSYLIVFLFLF
ncbi:endonuclease MutS2 isoform X2 [Rhodamnia argentea]|uniref:Endonuclease MutS2 isoform X2 n=1 Tax=Rhodamnia argentea TaxID=178133 RepID=A0A8B8MS21_9MYRT|nr:endonuclease MutS2 isoform X2 [Rhodamnia argentea]